MTDNQQVDAPRTLTSNELAMVVKLQREMRRWSQETLASLSRLNVRTIQRVEGGMPSDVDTRRALARAFDCADIDIFNKPQAIPTPERVKAEREQFEREHLILDVHVATSGRELGRVYETCTMDVAHPAIELNPDAEVAFARIVDYLRDWRDAASEYSEEDKLEVYAEMQSYLDKVEKAGIAVCYGLRKTKISSASWVDKTPWGVTIVYLTAFPKADCLDKMAVRREVQFG